MADLFQAESLDVNELMQRIEKTIQEKKDLNVLKESEITDISNMELQPLPDFLEIPNPYQAHLYPESPLPQFSALQGEISESGAVKAVMKKIRQLLMPLIRFFTRPIYLELRNALVETQTNLAAIIPITYQSKEYVKLLHNALNNCIVEMSKLKIDLEMQKTKLRMLEDRMQFLENRQRETEKLINQQ